MATVVHDRWADRGLVWRLVGEACGSDDRGELGIIHLGPCLAWLVLISDTADLPSGTCDRILKHRSHLVERKTTLGTTIGEMP